MSPYGGADRQLGVGKSHPALAKASATGCWMFHVFIRCARQCLPLHQIRWWWPQRWSGSKDGAFMSQRMKTCSLSAIWYSSLYFRGYLLRSECLLYIYMKSLCIKSPPTASLMMIWSSTKTYGRTSLQWEWWSTGTGCPQGLWSLLWRYSRPIWMPICAT